MKKLVTNHSETSCCILDSQTCLGASCSGSESDSGSNIYDCTTMLSLAAMVLPGFMPRVASVLAPNSCHGSVKLWKRGVGRAVAHYHLKEQALKLGTQTSHSKKGLGFRWKGAVERAPSCIVSKAYHWHFIKTLGNCNTKVTQSHSVLCRVLQIYAPSSP